MEEKFNDFWDSKNLCTVSLCLYFWNGIFFDWSIVDNQCYVSFRCTTSWVHMIYMLYCYAHHKCNYHLSPYKTITIPLTIFLMLYLLAPWLIHSIIGSPYLPLPSSILPIRLLLSPLGNVSFSLYFCVCFCFFFVCLGSTCKRTHVIFVFLSLT